MNEAIEEVSNDGLIIGLAAAGGVIALIVLAVVVVFIMRKRKENEVKKHPIHSEDDASQSGVELSSEDGNEKDKSKLKLEDMSDEGEHASTNSNQAKKGRQGKQTKRNDDESD